MYTVLPLNISKNYFSDLDLVSQVVKKQPYRYTKVRPHTFREIIKKQKRKKTAKLPQDTGLRHGILGQLTMKQLIH